MPVSRAAREAIQKGSLIRKMFEAGIEMRARLGADSVFDFSLGNPDLEPPPEFLEALKAAAGSDEPGSHGYMVNAGYGFARAAMAEKVSLEHGVALGADDIVMTSGAAGALNIVFKTILDPGDEVIVVRPYFVDYRAYVANHGGVLVVADPSADFSLDPGAIARVLSPRTAAVLVNSPNNPTGRIYPREAIEALAALLAEHGRKVGRVPYIVVDEPYRDIVYGGAVVPPVMSAYPETIVASSFSKSLSVPGERIGYVAVHPDCADKGTMIAALAAANRTLGFMNAPALLQRAVAASWRAKPDVSRYARRRDALAAILTEAGIRFAEPEGAFYLFCAVPEGAEAGGAREPAGRDPEAAKASDDLRFVEAMQGFGVLAVPGTGFGYPGWFRLCYCVPEATIAASRPAFLAAAKEWRGTARR